MAKEYSALVNDLVLDVTTTFDVDPNTRLAKPRLRAMLEDLGATYDDKVSAPAPAPKDDPDDSASFDTLPHSDDEAITTRAEPALSFPWRIPVLFIIDTSCDPLSLHSADVAPIAKAFTDLTALLASPPVTLQLNHPIDVSLIAYAEQPVLLHDWSDIADCPVRFTPQLHGAAHAAPVFRMMRDHLHKLYQRYQRTQTGFDIPHILHITRGAPADLQPDSADWYTTKALFDQIYGIPHAYPHANFHHFIISSDDGHSGLSGQSIYRTLAPPHFVHDLNQALAKIEPIFKYSNDQPAYLDPKLAALSPNPFLDASNAHPT